MNLGEEPEDVLTIDESTILLDQNKENTKKKTPPKRPVKDPDQLDLFAEEGEVVPDKPVSEEELEIQLATNIAEVVGNWSIPVDEDGNIVEPDPDTVTIDEKQEPILLNKDLLLDDNIIGTEVEFEIIENDWYLSDREDKAAEPWMEVPIYVKIGDQYIGKLQASQNEERKAIVEKLQKGEKVTTNINSIRANNFNNTRTVDNVEEVVFRDPREVFGNNDDILLVHTVVINDGDVVTSQWSLGEVHPDKDKGDLNKIRVNIEEDQDVQQNQIGIVIRSKHNPQPIDRIAYLSTANLSDNAKLKVLEALESRDFDKASEIVASSLIRKDAENNSSFLEFGVFPAIKDKTGKTIPGEDWMIYYSPTLNKLIRIKETELVKALNGNKAYFNEVKIGKDEKVIIANKYNTDLIDIDIKKDISDFLETKKYNVMRDGANLKGAYISPVTGYEYATYQDYLFDEKEIGEERVLGKGHHSILSTDIIKKRESMFNNPEVKFGKGNVLEDTAPEIIKKAKIKPAAPAPAAPIDSQIKKVTLKELRELTKKTDGLSENTEDYFYIDDTFNKMNNKAIQVKKGRFAFSMTVDRKGVIKPLNILDLRGDKSFYYTKTVDGAGRIQKSSPDFPITEAEKVLTEIQNLAKPIIALEAPVAPAVTVAPAAPAIPITTTIPEKYKLNVSGSKDSPNANREIENLKAIGREMDETNMSWQLGNLRHKADTGQLIVDIILPNGKSFLMYRSTGKGTTADTKGLWTPIPGFAKNGWYIKMRHKGVDPKKNKYGIEAFKDIAMSLEMNEEVLFPAPVKTLIRKSEYEVHITGDMISGWDLSQNTELYHAPDIMIKDNRHKWRNQGDTAFQEEVQNGKKVFTIINSTIYRGSRKAAITASMVFDEHTSRTLEDVKGNLNTLMNSLLATKDKGINRFDNLAMLKLKRLNFKEITTPTDITVETIKKSDNSQINDLFDNLGGIDPVTGKPRKCD